MNKLKRFFDRNGKRLMSVMLTLMLCISMLGVGMVAKADDEPLDTTFYTMSSAAAGWLSNEVAKSSNGQGPTVDGGDVGGLLGYCDEADTSGIIVDFIQSSFSTSSSSYSYDALRLMGGEYINYGNYGRVLKNLGIDDTDNSGKKPLRFITGGLMLGLFNMSTFINRIFEGMIDFMKAINPFRLFKVNGADMINVGTATGALTGIERIKITGGNSLSDYISNIYVFIRDNFSWVIIIPGALGILIFSMFLTKKDKGFEIKKFIWRIAVIAFVIPVMGSLYTTSLNWLGDTISPSNGTPAVKIIASMFVDFEGWVKADNLSLNNTHIHIDDLQASNAAMQMEANISSLRNTALAINNKALQVQGLSDGLLGSSAGDASDVASWNKSINESSGSDLSEVNAAVYVQDLIERYMSGNFYDPGEYQSYKKASWGGLSAYEDVVDGTNELLDWTNNDAFDTYVSGGSNELWHSGASKPWYGMSDMSMYNYLSSNFTNTGIEVYSNEKAASGYVRKMHYSVNMVGNGLTTVFMYINGGVMLGCLIILAISYACGMMIATVKRTFRVITSMPLATLGSLRFGAKLIGNTVMMLAEVVATLFMYSIGVSLLYGVMNVIDGLFSTTIATLALGVVGKTMCEYIMSTIMYIWIAIMLIRYRKKAVKAFDEAVADVINRLVPGAKSSDMIDPQKPSLASRALGAGGAAAGAAAAGYAMNKMAGAGDAAKGNASGETSATADGGDGGGGNGGDGGDGGDVNINNSSDVAVSDDDTVNADMDAGGDGFDNDDDSEGREAIGASDLDEAGNGIEEGDNNIDVDNLDGDESADVDNMTEDAGEGEDVGEAEAGAAAGADADAPGGASAPKGNAASGQKAVKSAQSDLAKSEAEKANLKKALAQSGGQTSTGGKGGKGQSMSDSQAQNGYKAAMNGNLKAPAASNEKPGIGAKAAQQKKGAPLTPAERQAADNAVQSIKDRSAAPVRGVAPLTGGQQKAVTNAAMKAAQAANGGKPLSGQQKKEVAAAANAMAMEANKNANLSNTNQEAAKMAAIAANGGKALSANDKQMVSQAASQVQAAAQRATSPEGLAQAAALQAAQAANGGRPLTTSQYQSVKQTAAQSASQVQSAAMAAAEAAKGAPLTAGEVSAVREQCGVQAAQQAAVNAVEQCMEQPLTEGQRASLMEAAKGHAGSIIADNSQVRQAEQSAAAAAKAMQTAHRLGRMPAQQYAQMMGNVRQATQQTVANAQPVNMASRAAVNAANQVRASRGQAPMNAAQTNQVVQNVAGSPEVQSQQAAVMRQQAYVNDAQATARQMMDAYGGGSDGAQMSDGSYSAQAASIRAQANSNYAEIESLKTQLAARGYSQSQIDAIARNENAAMRGETQNAQASDGPRIDVKQAAMFGAARHVVNDHQQVQQSMEQQRAAMDAEGAAKQPKPKRTLGSSTADDLLE